MPITFNFKICDNAAECNGIAACPQHAITWNAKKKTLEADNSKCIACGACARSCPVEGAILVAKDDEEYKWMLKQIKEDPRTIDELLKERYGAATGSGKNALKAVDFEKTMKKSKELTFIELFKPQYISCRTHSIKYEELAPNASFKVWKIDCAENESAAKKLGVNLFPTVVVFKDGEEKGRFSGKVTSAKKEEFKKWFEKATS